MCRLLAFTSLERKSFYDVVGSDFEKFVALSAEHKDGWGIGYEGEVVKDINPAKESDLLAETGKNLETAGALFHLRLASKGITINIDNNKSDNFMLHYNNIILFYICYYLWVLYNLLYIRNIGNILL